ncbi:MAG: HigA family addiction module antidote protein [Nitrospirae bacterium]|nr:HigA family addiction module antidote protein [Nitrospirota bacterium]MBI3593791.1 HigA family addiction module antidote protein [Nitrospirota bacterium]
MSKMMRNPTTPGEILKEEFLVPLKMTQAELALHLNCDVKVINRIINGHSGVTAEMAIKLAAAFSTSPEFWINAQKAVDLYKASKNIGKLPKSLLLKTV